MFAKLITSRESPVLRKIVMAIVGLLFVAHAASGTTLAWNANTESNIAGYHLRYGTSKGTYTQTLDAGKTTTATLSNLTAGTTYFAVVTAYNTAAQESLASNEVSFVPATTTPTPSPTPITSPTPSPTPITSPTPSPTPITSPTPSPTPITSPTPPPTSVPSIWTATSVPTLMDTGPDSAVELGVKFRSDVAGVITGIRFYKSSANTGTHVGNLWTSAGTRLATATFAGETASGWQQVNFAKPVAITANTVYVASYHANSGHYSADLNYFSTKGMDTPPLHALANGVSGVNGVYVYGTSSAFPKNAWQASNYWVDVSFQSGTAPTLTSIAVAPVNPTIVTGGSQQFTATGTYVSGTQNITSQVTWKSSNTATATISAGGLATAAATGTTSISAALSGATASSLLTVKSGSVAITTGTLPNGSLNVAYTGALAASGGTAPYVWSISSGALPSGLTMNASGAITGTPIVTGTFSLTAKVTDASNPIQTASKALSIIVSTASTSTGTNIWPSTTVPKLVDGGADSSVELGVKFKSDVAGTITGIRFYKAGTNKGTHVGNLWTITGTKLATVTFTGETASGWQQVNFATPVAITANTVYVASYHATTGHYSADLGYFSKGVDNPPLHALANGVSGANGIYAYGKNSAFPNQSWSSANYWVDVIFKP